MKVLILAMKIEEDVKPENFSETLRSLRKKYARQLKTDDITLKVV